MQCTAHHDRADASPRLFELETDSSPSLMIKFVKELLPDRVSEWPPFLRKRARFGNVSAVRSRTRDSSTVNSPPPNRMVPDPVIESTVSMTPFKSNVAPVDTMTSVVLERLPSVVELFSRSVPACTFVVPE